MRWFRKGSASRQGLENNPQFRCCFSCCHVQSGTIALGVYNLVTQIIAICVLTYAICHPEILVENNRAQSIDALAGSDVFNPNDVVGAKKTNENVDMNMSPELPTPVALKSGDNDFDANSPYLIGKSDLVVFSRRKIDSGDAHVALALVFGLAVLTFMMIYGAVKERPLYILPFFCIQVFDFIVSCLTAVGHYNWLPSVHDIITNNPDVPYRSELMKMNSQWISLSILLLYVVVLMLKAYFLGVVWACYQYLQAKRNVVLTFTATADGALVPTETDDAMFLPPDYDTAVKMPVPMPPPTVTAVNIEAPAPPPNYVP